ncbi:MAG: acyl-CoA dehydrogenase family protein [Alicyclobacillus macrosporangiidus]|uniref:acyl-CoA dehydrogenase family protein n=1 Tax=Alicyclobacillus macrosporangiidus TaxID=392015 RepID=UPI0026F25183|nr:acyl-CoA dehydrogenase family protein [Alicyclobacillus macrosporangiidus]MCL6599608.1 acyl-CoA dehydrogenase family protein [Alicyclobacillus macrosporangiidus]
MRFDLSESERQFRDEIREFADQYIAPTAQERDEKDIYPTEIIKRMARKGYTTLTLPTTYGGMGKSRLEACILMEEVAYSCAATAVSLITIFQAQTMLMLYGNDLVKASVLPRFREGLIASYALTESNRGSDIRHLETKAVLEGNEWVINGRKTFITSGSAAEFFIVLAETPVGVSVFAVDASLRGVRTEVGELSETFGLRNGPHLDLILDNVRVPVYHLVGTEGQGLKQAVTTLNNSRTLAAAISIGIARAAYDYSLAWVNRRTAFDQKVFDFQGIQWTFARMLTDINAARLLTYRAATLLDRGDKAISEASQAKFFAATTATRVCADAIQVCGAFGTTVNAPLGRYLRDAKAYEIAGGSNEILLNTIAKEIKKAAVQ